MKIKYEEEFKSLNSFKITNDKLKLSESKGNKLLLKHFRNAFIVGALTEYLIVNTKICKKKIKKMKCIFIDLKLD